MTFVNPYAPPVIPGAPAGDDPFQLNDLSGPW